MEVDWHSPANHLAIHPSTPTDGEGLLEWAAENGLHGCCFFQTSGSEGLPKWVVLEKQSFLLSAQSVNAHFEVSASDHWLITLPLHHVGGFSILARAHLAGSQTSLSLEKWEPRTFVRHCEEKKITLTSLVPAQVHDLVHQRLTAPTSLRAAIIGGGGMTPLLAEQAAELGWKVFQSYGMTEAASQIATVPYNPFGPVFDVHSLEVLPHWQVSTDADEHLVLRGPGLARGYCKRSPSQPWIWEPIDPTQGLRTRDKVKLWSHGTRRFLQFLGRESGYIKILGELVHLAPSQAKVENLARQLRWPTLPVLIALPDERRESRLVLVLENPDQDPQPLLDLYNAGTLPLLSLSLSQVIRIPRIPRSDLGKVQIPKLMKLLLPDE